MPASSRLAAARGRLARGTRVAGHLLLAAVCIETAARLDDTLTWGAPLWGRYDAYGVRAKDADGLVHNVPGARFEKWQINPIGFRGAPVSPVKPSGRVRVACLGTSETFGLHEREGGDWPSQLGRLLRDRHPGAEAFNAAVVGLEQDVRWPYAERYVLPLRPDVVVLYLNVLSDATFEPHPASPPPPSWAWLLPTRAATKLYQVAKGAIPARAWNALRVWRLERSVRRAELALQAAGSRPLDAVPPEAEARFERHLRELVRSLRQRGVAPVLATYPTLGSPENRLAEHQEFLALREWDARLSEAGLLDAAARLNGAVRRVAADLDVPLADADAAVPKARTAFADYVHYTDAGAQRVAATVLAALERGGLLEGPISVGVRQDGVGR